MNLNADIPPSNVSKMIIERVGLDLYFKVLVVDKVLECVHDVYPLWKFSSLIFSSYSVGFSSLEG